MLEYRLVRCETSNSFPQTNEAIKTQNVLSAAQRELLEHLQTFLTRQRQDRFEEILSRRTRHLTVVLEDVFQPHNQSAVLRSADAIGIQDVHIIETGSRLDIARDIALGCDRWLTIHRHNDSADNTRDCLTKLKRQGYRILAASPHAPAVPLPDVSVTQKTALVIGHETEGVSTAALEWADERVVIPMWGFVESFNLSVAAALCLYDLRVKLDASSLDWTLSAEEIEELRFLWTRRSIPNVEAIERRFAST